jgi:hypothetical protein
VQFVGYCLWAALGLSPGHAGMPHVPRLPQPSLLHDIEGNITAVAGSPTLRFRDRSRLPSLATLTLILICKFSPVSFDSFREIAGFL